MIYPEHVIQKFWSKVAKCIHGDGCKECCWLWQGSYVRGYGSMFIPKAYRRIKTSQTRANRICIEITTGEALPPNIHALHNCPAGDNPACVNPAHLWKGTIDDNQKDSMRKGRRPTGDAHGLRLHPEALHRGEDNHSAKLTASRVQQSRLLSLNGWSQARIARFMGVSRRAIEALLTGETWQHIPWPQADERPLTPAEYARRQGKYCPCCRSARLTQEGMDLHKANGTISNIKVCLECQSKWCETYVVTHYEQLTLGQKALTLYE